MSGERGDNVLDAILIYCLDELEAGLGGVEAEPQDQREQEGDDRRPERHELGVPVRELLVSPRQQQDEDHPDQRQEGNDREDRPVLHRAIP